METLYALGAISDYRCRLETSECSRDLIARKMLIDEFLTDVDNGAGEPVNVAYTLYLKYMEYLHKSEGFEDAEKMFETMADEAGNLINYFDFVSEKEYQYV